MADFLSSMADASRERLTRAMQQTPMEEIRRRAVARPKRKPLELHVDGFDLIAEVKRSAPSQGVLSEAVGDDARQMVAAQSSAYVAGGAAAISVLTEPTAFSGHLVDVATADRVVSVPVMRKDFLVDAYQVYEARAHDASGVLLIARMLDPTRISSFVTAAEQTGQFILLEIFDAAELRTVDRVINLVAGRDVTLLIGVNARNLATLSVDVERFSSLAAQLPREYPLVAESGLHTAADVSGVAALGYRLALVGTALMRSNNPATTASQFVDAGRRAAKACASG